MLNMKEEPVKWQIADRFGYWTARCAMRNWSQESVNYALSQLNFEQLFNTELGRIEKEDFERWRTEAIQDIQRIEFVNKTDGKLKGMPLGWAAKMITIYLKTTCYLGGFGRENLDNLIHTPLDNILVTNLRDRFKGCPHLVQGLSAFRTIEGLSEEGLRCLHRFV